MSTERRIPDATVGRLPVYLRVLGDLHDADVTTVSSDQLADLAGFNAAKVRKDLSYLGTYGTRGVGYDVGYLRFEITARLGLSSATGVAIVGLGNLGRALASHRGFRERGFPVVALYDIDPAKVGSELAGVTVSHLDELGTGGEPLVAIGVIATPPAAAQEVADRLVAAGMRAILNFAPGLISVADDVIVRKVDLASELQVLSYYHHRNSPAEPANALTDALPSHRTDDAVAAPRAAR
jgi:redox-sensing transcriptional repressor